VFEEQQLTYAELNARANQLAWYLRSVGVGADVPVGICIERSLELVVGLFGILKAGGAYVPLDPSYPTARLASMLDDTGARVVVAGKSLRDVLPLTASMRIYLDAPPPDLRRQPTRDPASVTSPEHLAYIIYTSGSTGKPKGVMVEHRALVNHMEWMRTTFDFGPDDSVLQKTSVAFDAAVWEFFATLLVGGRLVIAPPNTHQDPARIIDAIRRHDVTTLQVVPSLLRMLVDEPELAACKTLRRVFCGGEALPGEAARDLLARCDARLYNLYGPTETCIDSIWWQCRRGDGRGSVPIGRPIANTRVVCARWPATDAFARSA
jgi:amino acid adenylation domain-containing protein